MIIRTQKNQAETTLFLTGRLDTATAPELDVAITENASGAAHLRLDMSGLEYVSSAGLRVLLAAQKRMTKTGGTLTLCGVGEVVREVLEITGFTDILTIE